MAANDVMELMFGSEPVADDVDRWKQEGFVFSSLVCWGLKQRQGGPCGILASSQAFLLADLLVSGSMPNPDSTRCKGALINALATMLWRSRPMNDCSAIWTDEKHASKEELTSAISKSDLEAPGAVITFVTSLICTRTIEGVREDLNFESDPLVGRFGHGTQELINLCLFGRAVSHLFDGKRFLAPHVEISGIPARGPIGLLSLHEVLQYQKVGNWCRCPELPIWIIASSSHYTVLFSMDLEVGKLSQTEIAEHSAYSEFARYDQSDSGFIPISDLIHVLSRLGRTDLTTATQFELLKRRLDPDGCSIVLWSALWNVLQDGDTGPWSCQACTYLNIVPSNKCMICETAKPDGQIVWDPVQPKSFSPRKFVLYHYNGMANHSGADVQYKEVDVTLVDSDGIFQGQSAGRGLREIIQTRWPDAIIDYPGDIEPRIE